MLYIFLLVVSLFVGSFSFALTKTLVIIHPFPMILNVFRLVISGFAYLLICNLYKFNKNILDSKHLLTDIFLGGGCIFISMALVQYATGMAPLAACGAVFGCSPIIAGLGSYLFLKEKLSARQILMSFIVIAASFIPFLTTSDASGIVSPITILRNTQHFIYPMLLTFIGVILSNAFWIYMRCVQTQQERKLEDVLPRIYIGGAIFGLIASCLLKSPSTILLETLNILHNTKSIYLIFTASLLYSVLANSIYAITLRFYSATFVSLVTSMCLLTDSLMGRLILGERINPFVFPTAILISVCIYIYNNSVITLTEKEILPETVIEPQPKIIKYISSTQTDQAKTPSKTKKSTKDSSAQAGQAKSSTKATPKRTSKTKKSTKGSATQTDQTKKTTKTTPKRTSKTKKSSKNAATQTDEPKRSTKAAPKRTSKTKKSTKDAATQTDQTKKSTKTAAKRASKTKKSSKDAATQTDETKKSTKDAAI